MDCEALAGIDNEGQGGALFVAEGTLLLTNQTLLMSNRASGRGATLLSEGGVVTYSLPAPPGRWIAGLECLVYRKACSRDHKGSVLDPSCPHARDECSLLFNASASTTLGTPCQPLSINQPWCASTHMSLV